MGFRPFLSVLGSSEDTPTIKWLPSDLKRFSNFTCPMCNTSCVPNIMSLLAVHLLFKQSEILLKPLLMGISINLIVLSFGHPCSYDIGQLKICKSHSSVLLVCLNHL